MTKNPWAKRIVGYGEVATESILGNERNWRIHPKNQQDALLGILSEIGIVQNIIINTREDPAWPPGQRHVETLLDGHCRALLGLRHNQPTLPVTYVNLTPSEEAIVMATMDPLAAMAGTDREKLSDLLHDVSVADASVMQMLSELAVKEGIVPPESASVPTIQDVEPELDRAEALREQYGVALNQLWVLGRHRILCADSLDIVNVVRVLGGDRPDMIFADPPYGISIVATNVPVGGGEAYDIPFGGTKGPRRRDPVGGGESYKAKHGEYAIQRDQRRGTDSAAKPFGSKKDQRSSAPIIDVGKYAPVIGDETTTTARAAATILLQAYGNAAQVWWGGNYYADSLPASSCWLVWNKETNGNFADCELAWTNQPKAARLFTHRWNGMLRASEHGRRWHPTQKPAALAAWVYETLGKPGDIILDPFLGAGCSLIAAEQCQRMAHALELSPDYVAVALDRWAQLTGETPQLLKE